MAHQSGKNVLFLVTGMTPQIITETVWALACDPAIDDPWVPDEIHVMSTRHGLNQIRQRLFNEGHFAALLAAYGLPAIRFDERCLHTIQGSAGQPLDDLKTPEDNEFAADAICNMIRDFTRDANTSLHVSIAGGRKTMGFYAGYALSLYGRTQDRMSHVLVDENYEQAVNFFFPEPSGTQFATARDGKVIGPSSEARIWLADIRFVRMKEAIKAKHQLHGNEKFSAVVSKINDSFNQVTLHLIPSSSEIVVSGKYRFTLRPREFALLHWFSDRCRQGLPGIVAPRFDAADKQVKAVDSDALSPLELKNEFLKYYLPVKDEDYENEVGDLTVDKKFFHTVKSRLKSELERELGLELAARLAIEQSGKLAPYCLNLPAGAITVEDKPD